MSKEWVLALSPLLALRRSHRSLVVQLDGSNPTHARRPPSKARWRAVVRAEEKVHRVLWGFRPLVHEPVAAGPAKATPDCAGIIFCGKVCPRTPGSTFHS